jgi:hypothetical protein
VQLNSLAIHSRSPFRRQTIDHMIHYVRGPLMVPILAVQRSLAQIRSRGIFTTCYNFGQIAYSGGHLFVRYPYNRPFSLDVAETAHLRVVYLSLFICSYIGVNEIREKYTPEHNSMGRKESLAWHLGDAATSRRRDRQWLCSLLCGSLAC